MTINFNSILTLIIAGVISSLIVWYITERVVK